MASQHPPRSHPSPTQRPIPLHRLHRILRASRNITAGRGKPRRNRPLVSPQHPPHNVFSKLIQCALPQKLSDPRKTLSFRAEHDFPRSGKPCVVEGPCVSLASNSSKHPYRVLPTFCSITTKARATSFSTAPNSFVSKHFLGLITTSTSPA